MVDKHDNHSEWLIFIDTNVMLDFYRLRTSGPAKRQLQFIDKNHDRIITGAQVEMEFFKHRQKVITETMRDILKSEMNFDVMPPFLIETDAAKEMKKLKEQITKQRGIISDRIKKIMNDPAKKDEVYRCLKKLFNAKTALNLSLNREERHSIREEAQYRWSLGFPPRKPDDSSYGDAVNWEWIIYCAQLKPSNVIIVSRDEDYGQTKSEPPTINEWLAQEFVERVGGGKKIILTTHLTKAMQKLGEVVNDKDIEQEDKLVKSLGSIPDWLVERETGISNVVMKDIVDRVTFLQALRTARKLTEKKDE